MAAAALGQMTVIEPYSQCGGRFYTGSGVCTAGYYCESYGK